MLCEEHCFHSLLFLLHTASQLENLIYLLSLYLNICIHEEEKKY